MSTNCVICNQRCTDSLTVAITVQYASSSGESIVPDDVYLAHAECVRQVAHPDYKLNDAPR